MFCQYAMIGITNLESDLKAEEKISGVKILPNAKEYLKFLILATAYNIFQENLVSRYVSQLSITVTKYLRQTI
jgi:hypothetical protein